MLIPKEVGRDAIYPRGLRYIVPALKQEDYPP